MTARRAALVAALVALLVYLPALGNRFALDDGPIVERNAAAHSLGAAARAFGQTYWPPEHGAGLWRPMVILSFAADWQASGGSPAVLHATNIVLHALVTFLLVLAIAPFVTVSGALAGGLVFAVHPLHVEAVANLVGRAELLVALGLLAAILFARRARDEVGAGRSPVRFELATLAATLFALLSKEHAAIAVALLWIDDRARPAATGRVPGRLLSGVTLMTVAWLVIRRQVDNGLSFAAVAPTFFHMDASGRIATMLPTVFVILRLMVWPFDLSPDYHPMVVERLDHLTPVGLGGLVVLLSIAALAGLLWWRGKRAASWGLLVIGLAWLPTSNLLFPSGIVLAERTLYLSSVGLALLVALGADALAMRRAGRATLVLAVVMVPFAWTTIVRIPAWRSTRDLVVTALIAHPESYKVHQSAARVYWRMGQPEIALSEYRIAAEIYSADHIMLSELGSALMQAGHVPEARRVLERSEALGPNYIITQELLAQVFLLYNNPAAAYGHARRAVQLGPTTAEAARMLSASYVALGKADSARAVWPAFEARGGSLFDRWLLGAVAYASTGQPDSAAGAIARARMLLPAADTVAERRLGEAEREVRRLALPGSGLQNARQPGSRGPLPSSNR